MAGKKACVIFTAAKEAEANRVVERLNGEGYEVCVAKVTLEVAKAANEGASSIPPEVAECLDGAAVCVILVEEDQAISSALGALAGLASDGGSCVVTVGGSPESLPAELDDMIDGHVPSADSPELSDIVGGRPDRIKPDNTPATKRREDRVKCQ